MSDGRYRASKSEKGTKSGRSETQYLCPGEGEFEVKIGSYVKGTSYCRVLSFTCFVSGILVEWRGPGHQDTAHRHEDRPMSNVASARISYQKTNALNPDGS